VVEVQVGMTIVAEARAMLTSSLSRLVVDTGIATAVEAILEEVEDGDMTVTGVRVGMTIADEGTDPR
jgi:hypothetical protein